MPLNHHQQHAGNMRHTPAGTAPVSQNQVGTRSGSPTPFQRIADRLIDSVRKATRNNPQALMVVQSALPGVQRIEADFPGLPLTVTAAVPGPSEFLNFLDKACQHKSPRDQARIRLDVMGLRQLDQRLRAFGVQFSAILTTNGASTVFSRH